MSRRCGPIPIVLCRKIVLFIALLLALPAYNADAVELRACLRSQALTNDGDGEAASDKLASDDGSAILALEEESAEESNRRAGTGSRRVASVPQPFKLEHLKLQWDSWTTSQMVTTAAAIVLSEMLGFNVRFEKGRTSKETYQALANGDVHAALEAWPLSNRETFLKYVANENSSIYHYPYSTLFGRSGIFETCDRGAAADGMSRCSSGSGTEPILSDMLNTAEGQKHFKTAEDLFADSYTREEWRPKICDTQNCTVQILHIAKRGYDEGAVEKMVEMMGLPAKVVYLGEYNHTEAIWKAYTKRAGALVYSYYPNTNQYSISILDLPRAKIMPGIDFQPQRLAKFAWKGLRDHRGGDALSFLEGFDLKKEDYQELGRLYDLLNDAQSAACTWVKQNPSKWQHLVRFPERKSAPFFCPLNSDSAIGLCNETKYMIAGILFWLQMTLFVVIVIASQHLGQPKDFAEEGRVALEQALTGVERPVLKTNPSMMTRIWEGYVSRSGNYGKRVEFVRQLYAVPNALSHRRTFEAFKKSNVDDGMKLPPQFGPIRWNASLDRSTLFPYLFFSEGDGLKPVLLRALALGLFSGAVSTFLYMLVMWETYRTDHISYASGAPADFDGSYSKLVYETGKKISSLITAFKFFPSFLALGYVGYAIQRWRSFQATCYSIQGALCNVSLMVGGSMLDPSSPESKELAFRVYRYLQVIHLLVYKDKNAWYKLLRMEDFETMGLLTAEEIRVLKPADNKMIEALVSWILRDCLQAVEKNVLTPGFKSMIVTKIRSEVSAFNNLFAVGQPNLWAALMKLVCDCLILMFVLGSSFESFLYQLGPFQSYAVVFSIFLSVPWLCAQRLVTVLADPFSSHHDMFNTDSLVANAERTTFMNLRCGWHGLASETTSDSEPQKPEFNHNGNEGLKGETAREDLRTKGRAGSGVFSSEVVSGSYRDFSILDHGEDEALLLPSQEHMARAQLVFANAGTDHAVAPQALVSPYGKSTAVVKGRSLNWSEGDNARVNKSHYDIHDD